MTEQKQDKNTTGRDPNREHMTLSALWNLWMDNLKSWRQYREEHADLFTLNIQAGFRRIGGWLGRVRRSARTLAEERKDKRFPESELAAAQPEQRSAIDVRLRLDAHQRAGAAAASEPQ